MPSREVGPGEVSLEYLGNNAWQSRPWCGECGWKGEPCRTQSEAWEVAYAHRCPGPKDGDHE